MNSITALLGCKHPIIQGAMGFVSNPELVAAVSEADGFGLLATAFSEDLEAIRVQIRATRKLTSNPFGANLQMMNPLNQQIAELLIEEGIQAVTVSGGSPKTLVPFLKERGIKVMAVVPTVRAALGVEASGVDAVIAEGTESGGIQGLRGASTMVLVPAVVDAVKIPVIAAGGIGDSRGYKAAFALGAQGVQVGTLFIATHECAASADYKKTIIELLETGTEVMNMGQYRARMMRAIEVKKILKGESEDDLITSRPGLDESQDEQQEAGMMSAGEVAGLIHTIRSVKEVIEEMVS